MSPRSRPRRAVASALLVAGAVAAAPLAAMPPPLPTTAAERSGFERTGRYDEVIVLCTTFARAWPEAVRCEDFGTTPEGRPMKVLVVSRSGALTPEAARARGLPVVLMQGGIHAGEIDGKDAGFLALRELLVNEAAPGALKELVWVFVPVFNVDGHERFGAWNRPNQRGPVEMGWRTTAQNYNLNRDYLKADSPEMRAMLALVGRWDPLLVVDLHATNGAQFEHDISITGEPVTAGDPALRAIGRALRDGVVADLAAAGHLPVPFYPSFVEYENPASGIDDGVPPPRFSTGYFWLRNRLALLVETHSWRPYPQRVRSTRNTIVSVLARVAKDGAAWGREAAAADARAGALAGGELPVAWAPVGEGRMIEFRGYAYTRTPSEVSGALMTRYDETTPQAWRIPLRDTLAPSVTVDVPAAGYLVPAAHAARVADVLDVHGVAYRRLDAALSARPLEVFRADAIERSPTTVEGHARMTAKGAWAVEEHAIPAGSLFVPVAQAKARVVVSLFEPRAPDSLLAWGLFATAFEPKEYLEDYVAEAVAREMLAADAALGEAFAAKLRDDPDFAADPAKRLEFFARRHASWDERYMLYPVFRTDVAP